MPLFRYMCEKCGPQRRILPSEPATLNCTTCGLVLRRTPTGAVAQVLEVIDNGFQARAVVRPADAQRIFKEREIAHDAEYNPQFYETWSILGCQ